MPFRLLLVFLFSGITLVCRAQGEYNNWYFGNLAGITFNTTPPSALTNSQMYTNEGCASVSTAGGRLLFYTNGVSVWDSLHQLMPNGTGLMGNGSSSESALIVARPNTPGQYYIFTVDCYENNLANGLRYSLLDMSLNGGLGDIDPLQKNILLLYPVCEKLTSVLHANEQDVWVVTHLYGNNAFYSYQVTPAGVNTTPVISASGLPVSSNMIYSIGCMRASKQGNRLVSCVDYLNYFELFDFNKSTGAVSNAVSSPNTFQGAYGCEFSPDGSRLYITCEFNNVIHQFDLTLGAPGLVLASDQVVGTSAANTVYALQRGPDQKIYVIRAGQSWLGVINNPNQLGPACNYIDNGVDLLPNYSVIGLPNIINTPFYVNDFNALHFCLGDSTLFTADLRPVIDSVRWNFGDPASGGANSAAGDTVKHWYAQPGLYTVHLYCFQNGVPADTVVRIITILGAPQIHLGNDTTICNGAPLVLHAGTQANTYVWQDGSTDTFYTATHTGIYFVTANNSCGSDIDSITLHFYQPPQLHLRDSVLCTGQTELLDAGNPGAQYQWQDGSQASTLHVNQTGTYWVTVSNGCGFISDTAQALFDTLPKLSLGPDLSICADQSTLLTPDADSTWSYLWQDGSTLPHITVSQTTTLWLTVSNHCGSATDTLQVLASPCPQCLFVPNAFSPNADGSNDIFRPLIYCNLLQYKIQVFNRWGNLLFESTDKDQGWDGTYHGLPQMAGVYVYSISCTIGQASGSHLELLSGNVTLLR